MGRTLRLRGWWTAVPLPEALNRWPLLAVDGSEVHIRPHLSASSGEMLRQLALAGQSIVCLADFMTGADRRAGDLMQVLMKETIEVRQSINAVYYLNHPAVGASPASWISWLRTCPVAVISRGSGVI